MKKALTIIAQAITAILFFATFAMFYLIAAADYAERMGF